MKTYTSRTDSHENPAVSVLLENGDLMDGTAYAAGLNMATGRRVRKSSQQLKTDPASIQPWKEPRISMEDLLYFYDVNVWHRRCVLVKALLVGGLGYRIERKGEVIYDPSRGIDRQPDNPVVRLVKRPNTDPLESFQSILFRILVDWFALGNGYLEIGRDRASRVAELFHVPGRTIRRGARYEAYWQVKQGRQVEFANFGERNGKNEVIHLYQYDPGSDYYGLPDWFAALAAMGLDRTIIEFNTRLFANSMMAHLAVVVEGGKLSNAARDALRAFLKDRTTGVANAGRILLLEDERERVKVRFEKLNLEVKDLLIVEAQKHFRDVVIAAHGVLPRVLGIVTSGQLGATGEVEGQLRTFRETVLRPAQQLVENALAALTAEFDSDVRIQLTEMDITDIKADGDFYARMIEHGVYDAKEVRSILETV